MEYIFYLTNSCNLNCKYCYESDKINNKIDFSIIEKLLTEQSKLNDKTTNISFFGGEPLLEKQILYDTVNLCKELEKESKHRFFYSLTTNGTLIDDEFIKFCKKNNISVGISIDGDEYSHNLNRCDFELKGSFERVLENTKKCINANINCMALPVICLNNVSYLANNIKYLIDIGFKNITCNFNYSDNWDDNSLNILKQQYKEISNIYYSEFKRKNYIRIYPLDTKMYFHISIRKIMYTTNAIEGLHRQLRKMTKTKTVFPKNDALLKSLYLASNDITKKWTSPYHNWGQTIAQLKINFENRIPEVV